MFTEFRKVLLVVFSFLAFTAQSQVCDSLQGSCCTTMDRSPAGIMVGHPHPGGGWMVSYRFMFMDMKGLLDQGKKVGNEQVFNTYFMAPTTMQMQMHMLMVMYGISPSFTIMAMANYQAQSMDMDMFSMGTHNHADMIGQVDHLGMHAGTSGFSDTKLMLVYKALDRIEHRILTSLGLSLPTGSISKVGDSDAMFPGFRQAYMMQNGTGTVDIQPGVTYLYDLMDWSLGVQANYTIRPYKNKYNYRYGNELELNVWGARQIGSKLSLTLRSQNLLAGAISGSDNNLYLYSEPGTNPANYGGFRSNLLGGINLHLPEAILPKQKFGAEVGGAVYQRGNGIQMANKWCINANWTLSF
jgi:hypothetical protein